MANHTQRLLHGMAPTRHRPPLRCMYVHGTLVLRQKGSKTLTRGRYPPSTCNYIVVDAWSVRWSVRPGRFSRRLRFTLSDEHTASYCIAFALGGKPHYLCRNIISCRHVNPAKTILPSASMSRHPSKLLGREDARYLVRTTLTCHNDRQPASPGFSASHDDIP